MKTPPNGPNRHREFNTPAEMLSRAGYAVMLAAFVGGVVLGATGLVSGQWPLVLAGAGMYMTGALTRWWLQRTGRFAAADAAFNAATRPCATEKQSRRAELAVLLAQWEEHEQKRGSREFDPWELQVVRNDIRLLVKNDPALEQLFRDYQQRRAA